MVITMWKNNALTLKSYKLEYEKRFLCSVVGFNNRWQNIHATPTIDKSDSIAKNPKCETSLAIIATPNIVDFAKLATKASIVPIKFALDNGIPV